MSTAMHGSSISWWEQQSFIKRYDFIIIGAGIVGFNTALQLRLRFPDAEIAILERGWLPSGASTKNAGFACFGSPTELLSDLAHTPPEQVSALVAKRYQGLELLLSLLGKEPIGFEASGGHEVFQAHEADVFTQTLTQLPMLNALLKTVLPQHPVYTERTASQGYFGMQQVSGMIHIAGEGMIHTGKMMRALWDLVLSKGIRVFTGVEVARITETGIDAEVYISGGGAFKARHCFVTTNGFARQLLPELEVQPARAQVLITEPIPGLQIRGTFHSDAGYYYFRNVEDRVLLGGGRNLDFTGEQTYETGTTPQIMGSLERLLREVILPDQTVKISHSWSGIMGIGTQKSYILKSVHPHVHVGVRMGGMGVALGSLVGMELGNCPDHDV